MIPALGKNKKYVLFDLDGTLLPMNMDRYLELYIDGLSRAVGDLPAQSLRAVLWEGIFAMMKNDGTRTNREAFAAVFSARTGMDYYAREADFLRFYRQDYEKCAAACTSVPLAAQIVDVLEKKGYGVVIATSPLYPPVATQARIRWAGLADFDFPLVTTFEDFTFAKPDPRYYTQICSRLQVSPEECVMIGNDVHEDGAAREAGMDVMLVTDCLINQKNLPMADFACLTLKQLADWAQAASGR